MTKINKIVMHGFKSFAKRTEVLFNDNFNCVLGPNGAGKSNIIDSLCFVLGKTSSKSMRAERASNLIYNGGKTKNPAKQGEVSIYFDNANNRFPTADKEIKITRVVRQSGQSIYKINDKVRTRQQILELLSAAKVNPDGYNIILQGDIVRFVEMHPEDRRQLIEEISGIGIYEEKKKKAINELQKVEEKLKEAEIILTERSTHLKELKKDRDQALKFKGMTQRIKESKASLIKLQIDRKSAEKQEIKNNAEDCNKQLTALQEKIEKLKQDNTEKKAQIEAITKEIEERGEKGQLELNKEVETIRIDITKLNSRIETCSNEVSKIMQRKKSLKEDLAEIENKIQQLIKDKANIEKEKSSSVKEKLYIENKITQFKERHKLESLGNIEKDIEEIDKNGDDLQKGINQLREQQHNHIREKDKLQYLINTTDEKIQKVINIEKEYQQQLGQLKGQREEFKKATLELNKYLDYDTNLSKQIYDSKEKLNKAEEELAKLKTQAIGIKEVTYGDIAVKKILEQKNKIKGIYGTIAELGQVNSKYALALEIAAGPRIKSIVVENDAIAAEAIKYLKDNKLGVATFLPLNKIKAKSAQPSIEKLKDARGCHGLAIDLISFDKKFKDVFSHIFADTLVVDNIDTARRLGIGNARMVTLDGDLAELSGVMQGGYRERKKQALGFRESELSKNIDELEKTKNELSAKLDELEAKRKGNERLIQELREKKALLEAEIIKLEKSMHLEPTDLEANKERKAGLNAELKKIDENINSINEKIGSNNKELAELKGKKQRLRAMLSEIRDPTLLAELNTFNEKLTQLNESIIKNTADIKNTETQISAILSPEKEKAHQILKQLEREELDFKSESEGLVKKIKEKDAILKKKEAEAKDFYVKFKNLFTKRSEIDMVIRKNEQLIENKLEDSRKYEIQANTLSLKIAEMNAQLSALQYEFQQYEGVKIGTTKNEADLRNEIVKFEKLSTEIGSVNMRALEIYEEVEREYNNLLNKKDTLGKEKDDVMAMMAEIESKKKELFMRTYEVINTNFKKIFGMLSTKGDAYLEIENTKDPFSAGVLVKVKITGNKFLDIRSLSGGEKTLTALAVIFSILEHEPAPFYVLDEVDAALDKHNSEKLSKLIRKYSEKAQYIMVSHNDGVISEANTLYGVSMNQDGVSQVVSLKI